jgi:hypothetical protein
MVGHKSSLKALKSELEKVGVASSTQTEFCQGHTTRWGLAWTFLPELNLEVVPKKKKEKPPMKYVVPMPGNPLCYTVSAVTGKLKMLFTQLQVQTFNFCYSGSCAAFTVFYCTIHASSFSFVELINSMKQSP